MMFERQGRAVGGAVEVGFGGAVAREGIVALAKPESAPIRRAVRRAREQGMLIDLTCGRRGRTVLFMASGHVVRAAVEPKTLLARWSGAADEAADKRIVRFARNDVGQGPLYHFRHGEVSSRTKGTQARCCGSGNEEQ